jgi:hypothetical protein
VIGNQNRRGWLERGLSRLDGDDAGTVPAKLRAFQLILVLVIATEYWAKALSWWGRLEAADFLALGAVTLLGAAVVHGRRRRSAFAGLALLQIWYVWSEFPLAGNHRYLEAVFALLFALLNDQDAEERVLLLRSLRWLVIVVLFFSGLQKLVHGFYFRGQFLAYSLWRESFRPVLEPLLPATEYQRLTGYSGAVGDGPYLVDSPLFIATSNAVWIAEMALALLLIPRRTRTAACVVACVFMLATETAARELMFGVEFVCALLLFLRTDLLRRLVVPAAIILGLLILMRLGVLPEITFH